ncbi:MAG: 50S ribosomal protein L14 [Verrucomicrobia bacterium]|jgi:large subunit ribosomal protein L14|nr:50S ribosomal protein L14 [Verrucomicrobiota bacterium]
MIQMLSTIKVADNSGAKEAKMIRRLGQLKRTAGIGDEIVVHIRDAAPDSNIKKGTVCRAVVVRTRAPIRRSDGSYLRFDNNAVVLISNDGQPRGSRVYGPIARELRQRKYMKIISLAPEVL